MTSPANTITLGPKVLQLRGLRMEHVRRGLLDQMNTITRRIVAGDKATTLTPAQIEAHVDIVSASVDDQIARAEFDALLNALSPIAGVMLLTDAIPPILRLSGFTEKAPEQPAGEAHSPAA